MTKEGQSISINGVDFTLQSSSTPREILQGAIIILPSIESTTETQQTMTLALSLNNFKTGASPTGSINDCNLNEIATSPEGVEQKRTYNLQLVNAGTISNAVQILNDRPEPSYLQSGSTSKYTFMTRTISSDVALKQVISTLISGPEGTYDDSNTPQVAMGKNMVQETKSNIESIFTSEYSWNEFDYAGTYRVRGTAFFTQPGKEGTQLMRGPEKPLEIACDQSAHCRPRQINTQTQQPYCQAPEQHIVSNPAKKCFGTQLCCSSIQQSGTAVAESGFTI